MLNIQYDMYICIYVLLCSHVGLFQFIPQVTSFVSEKIYSFQQWHTGVVSRADGCHSEELSELIKLSFNTVLLASQHIIKQYNMLQSLMINSGV